MRERDQRSTWIVKRDPWKVPARGRKVLLSDVAMHAAQPTVLFVEEYARAAAIDPQDCGSAVRERSTPSKQIALAAEVNAQCFE